MQVITKVHCRSPWTIPDGRLRRAFLMSKHAVFCTSSSPSSYPPVLCRYLIRNDRLEKYAMLTVRLQPPNIQPSILSGMPFTHTFRRCDSALLTRTTRIARPRHCNNTCQTRPIAAKTDVAPVFQSSCRHRFFRLGGKSRWVLPKCANTKNPLGVRWRRTLHSRPRASHFASILHPKPSQIKCAIPGNGASRRRNHTCVFPVLCSQLM